jgi:hypothetical protein
MAAANSAGLILDLSLDVQVLVHKSKPNAQQLEMVDRLLALEPRTVSNMNRLLNDHITKCFSQLRKTAGRSK